MEVRSYRRVSGSDASIHQSVGRRSDRGGTRHRDIRLHRDRRDGAAGHPGNHDELPGQGLLPAVQHRAQTSHVEHLPGCSHLLQELDMGEVACALQGRCPADSHLSRPRIRQPVGVGRPVDGANPESDLRALGRALPDAPRHGRGHGRRAPSQGAAARSSTGSRSRPTTAGCATSRPRRSTTAVPGSMPMWWPTSPSGTR